MSQIWKQRLFNVIVFALVLILAAGTLFGLNSFSRRGWSMGSAENLTDDETEFVSLSYYFVVSSVPKDLATVNSAVNKILREKLNCEVRLKPIIESEYESTLNIMINTRDEFDICFTSNWVLDYYQNAKLGAFVDISGLLEKYVPTALEIIPEKLWNAATVNNGIYGVINNQIVPRTAGLTFNTKWYQAFMAEHPNYVFDSLESVESYLDFCYEQGADTTNMMEGFYPQGLLALWGVDDIGGMSSPGIVRAEDESLQVVNQFETKEFTDTIELARRFYEKGYMGDISQSLVPSKELVYLSSTWKPGASAEESLSRGVDLTSVAIGPSRTYNSWLLNSMNAISATSRNPIRALKVLELLYSDAELFNMMNFGIEGIHYVKQADNYVRTVANSGYYLATGWAFGNQFNSYLLPGQDADLWAQTETLNETAEDSVLVGFQFDPAPVRNQLANCNSVYEEYVTTLLNGAYEGQTQNKYREFLDKLRAAGSDEVIAEKQRQVNAWRAAQS